LERSFEGQKEKGGTRRKNGGIEGVRGLLSMKMTSPTNSCEQGAAMNQGDLQGPAHPRSLLASEINLRPLNIYFSV